MFISMINFRDSFSLICTLLVNNLFCLCFNFHLGILLSIHKGKWWLMLPFVLLIPHLPLCLCSEPVTAIARHLSGHFKLRTISQLAFVDSIVKDILSSLLNNLRFAFCLKWLKDSQVYLSWRISFLAICLKTTQSALSLS